MIFVSNETAIKTTLKQKSQQKCLYYCYEIILVIGNRFCSDGYQILYVFQMLSQCC